MRVDLDHLQCPKCGKLFVPGAEAMRRGLRLAIEVSFILFLFYANLLMGEFEKSGMGQRKGLIWALSDIFTRSNLAIAFVAAAIGYVLFEFLRTRL